MSRIRTGLVIAAALMIGGCSDAGRIFGFERSGPDEFTVVRHQPLSMPPDATLRPPQQGTSRTTRDLSSNEARESLLTSTPEGAEPVPGVAVPQYPELAGQSQGEAALVQRAAAYYGVESGIRQIVDEESRRIALEQDSFVQKLLFWQKPPPPGTPLDATAESRRLRENAALGKPANAGTAPLIVRKKSGVSSLF